MQSQGRNSSASEHCIHPLFPQEKEVCLSGSALRYADRRGRRLWVVGQNNTLHYTLVKNKPQKEIHATPNFPRLRSQSTLTLSLL